jgi:ubiquinone/menaquinone biosynthesis C-methylase UbiE
VHKTLIEYYNNYDEESRLIKDNAHSIEYITNIHYIEKYCSPNDKILDGCAGVGRYAFYLAQKGYKVTAGDIVPHYIDIIKNKDKERHILQEIKINDILNMDFPDNSFDIVLCMGALYHLENVQDRKRAVEECNRVLKAQGIIIISYINAFAQMLLHSKKGGQNFKKAYNIFRNIERDNIFVNTSPNEIKQMMEDNGFETIKNIASDGVAYLLSEQINEATDEEFGTWVHYHLETCEEESILGNSLHALYIGKKQFSCAPFPHRS